MERLKAAFFFGLALLWLPTSAEAQTKASTLLSIESCKVAYADWRDSQAAATAEENDKALDLAKQAIENYDLCSDAEMGLLNLTRLRLLEVAPMEYVAAVKATDDPGSGDYRVMLVKIESDLLFVCSSGYSAASLAAPNVNVPTYLDFGNLSVLRNIDGDTVEKLKSCSDALRSGSKWSP